MTWQAINKVLGLALIDEIFANSLLKAPCEALRMYNIQIPQEDLEFLCSCKAQTLYELSQQWIEKLGHESSE